MTRKCRRYTHEEDTWLIDNIHKYTYPELTEKFNDHFNLSVTCGSVRCHMINTLGFHRNTIHFYSKAENNWLQSNVSSYSSWRGVASAFNQIFHTNVSRDSILSHCTNILNLHLNNQHVYTSEEDEWIINNFDTCTYDELVERFNSEFNLSVTYHSLTSHILKYLKLRKTINRGDIKKNERRCTNILPIGTERYNGYHVYVKVDDQVNDCKDGRMPSKHRDLNWKRKDYIIWEQHGGRLPVDSNELLIHLDGDRKNCNIENLYLTTRKINLMLSKNNWHSDNPEITLLGIKWCELYYAMKEKKS